jgi:hypothetical protein
MTITNGAHKLRNLWRGALLLGLLTTATPATSMVNMSKGQTVYVPAYSQVYSSHRNRPFNLATTLSIRNTDPHHAITVYLIDYHDSNGIRVRSYVQEPIALTPWASTQVVVKHLDTSTSGGAGASFVVKWRAQKKVNAPLIEAILVGTASPRAIAFVRRGQVIQDVTACSCDCATYGKATR